VLTEFYLRFETFSVVQDHWFTELDSSVYGRA
jgi:hypothetical protein